MIRKVTTKSRINLKFKNEGLFSIVRNSGKYNSSLKIQHRHFYVLSGLSPVAQAAMRLVTNLRNHCKNQNKNSNTL